MKQVMIEYPYAKVREIVESVKDVDAVSAGLSPVTIRILTSKNKYVNIGLEEVDAGSCRLIENMNSYQVTENELVEARTKILEKLGHGRSEGQKPVA